MNIFNDLISENSLCFDVGANIGKKTDLFLSLGAKVICIEPQINCIDILSEKFRDNEKIKIVNIALGEKEDELDIFISPSDTVSTMSRDFIEATSLERFKGIIWDKKEKVKVTTLDNIISEYGLPHYCKIDVEGYELEILKGLTKKIKFISIEFTPELKNKTFECISTIDKIGEYEYNYSEGESHLFAFDSWKTSEEIIDFLKENNDFRVSFGDLYAKLIK
jgi:FkbM family methyltransferase